MDADLIETSDDGFLGGALTIRQPVRGYRAGIDPVLLAAAVPARAGESVLELGCGVGTAILCLGRRVPGLALTGLELQDAYAALACHNAESNDLPMDVLIGSISEIPGALRSQSFDHVMMNPPFFDGGNRTETAKPGRETALRASEPPELWCDAALRRLKPGGYLTIIHVPERLPALLSALNTRASIRVHPIAPRDGKAAHRIILVAQKGRKAALTLAAPAILHQGHRHENDGDSYRPEVSCILRTAAPWPWNAR